MRQSTAPVLPFKQESIFILDTSSSLTTLIHVVLIETYFDVGHICTAMLFTTTIPSRGTGSKALSVQQAAQLRVYESLS